MFLENAAQRITLLPMATVSFEIEEDKLKAYRRQAKAAGLSLSEFIRRRMDGEVTYNKPKTPKTVIAKYSGVRVFAGDPSYIPLTNESVKEMLSDFP